VDRRIPPERERRRSKARFRCRPCKRFVIATDYGVCPHCGLGPPNAVNGGGLDRDAWRDARARARSLGVGPAYWMIAAGFAVALGVTAAVLAVW
jgi:hypothetical protein